jgi:hypothetical protein
MTTAKRLVTGNEIVGGYALAGITLCLGVYFSTLVGPGDAWLAVSRPFSILAALIVLKCTFRLGTIAWLSRQTRRWRNCLDQRGTEPRNVSDRRDRRNFCSRADRDRGRSTGKVNNLPNPFPGADPGQRHASC